MSQTKAEATIARMMTSIHNGKEYEMETTPDGRIRVSTSSRYCVLPLDTAKDVLNPASAHRPKRPLQSMAIDSFERDLRGLVRDLQADSAVKRTV